LWSKEALLERRDWKIVINKEGKEIRTKGIGTANFNQEFRNIPITAEDKVVKEHWIRYYVPPLVFDYIILSIDPATSTKQRGDYTWICVLWVKDWKKYVIYSKSVKLAPRELEKFIIMLNDKFQPDIIVKESNIEIKLADDLKARWLPIKNVYSHKDKQTRLLWVAGIIEVWDLYFLQNKQENLIEQLTNFPDVEHDDEMDALVLALIESQEYLESWASGGWVELI
jgi:predicted phage terminase large subunit-like protein